MGDCPCKAENIMAKAKTESSKKVSSKELIAALNEVMLKLADAADETNIDHRASLVKLESTIKFIESRWGK